MGAILSHLLSPLPAPLTGNHKRVLILTGHAEGRACFFFVDGALRVEGINLPGEKNLRASHLHGRQLQGDGFALDGVGAGAQDSQGIRKHSDVILSHDEILPIVIHGVLYFVSG
jgi:hypothetical protein